MGKTKKANRTKGNTRPSSSEHSAQLLTSSGKSFSGFIGFDSLEKDIPSYVPVTGQHSSDVADFSVDSELRMVMRKMLKRDNITRLKAVQEFGDLCAEKDKDTLKNVLPFWPRLFNKLALDYDRRIREATHQANGKLIANVKREIAPFLKNIMGVWLIGQNDTYAPSASAAQNSFIDTFPKNKQSEALIHCKNEIFSLFKDNLFEQTAKTMSDPNSVSAEDIESKYILVISATLQAMKFFYLTVSQKELSDIKDDYLSILSENRFWKYAKSKESQIRGSWYSLIGFLSHVQPEFFLEMEKKLVSAVFGCLAESDPVVAPAVWEAALHIVVSFENCWLGVSIQKAILPQLWALLNEAGRGNAHVIYPCILPFLSKFPKDVISKDTFLAQFFTCLKHSVLLDSLKLSVRECDAILATLIECLQYISFCVLENPKEGSELLDKVLSDQVLPLVEMSFYESKYSYLATSKFYSLLGTLIQKIESKCLNESEEVKKTYSTVLISFWNNLYEIFVKFFDKREEEKKKISVYITYFFHSIFNSFSIKTEKSKVRFEDENESHETQTPLHNTPTVDLYNKMPITFMHIIKVINILCNKTDEQINVCYLKILDEILASTLNADYLKDILRSFEESLDTSKKACLTFFNKIVHKWILTDKLDQPSIMCISDIVFNLCSSVSEDEALDMLNDCCKVKNAIFLENILNKGLNVYVEEPVMQNWLKSSILIECILNGFKEIMKSVINDDVLKDEAIVLAHKNMLLTCLITRDLQDSLIQNKSLPDILSFLKENMERVLTCKNNDLAVQISCSIIKETLQNCKDCWNCESTDDLLFQLFSWNIHAEQFELSDKNGSLISDVWQTAILSFYKNTATGKKATFLIKASKALNSSLCNLTTTQKASKIFDEILNLLLTVENVLNSFPDCYSLTFVLSELLENILPSDLEWQKLKDSLTFSKLTSVVRKKVIFDCYAGDNSNVSSDKVFKMFMAAKVVSQIFTQFINKCSPGEDEKYFEQYLKKQIPELLWCVSYYTGNGYLNKDFEIKLDVDVLDEHCLKILKFIPFENLKIILKDMFLCSLFEGLCWALPFQLLVEKIEILYPGSVAVFDELISEASMMESDYVSLIVQLLSRHVSKEKKVFYLKNLLGDLTDCLNDQSNEINDEFLRKLGEVCCFIQDAEVLDAEVKNLLSTFFSMFSSLSERPKDLTLFNLEFVLLMTSLVQYSPSLVTKNSWCFLQSFLSSNLKIGKSKTFDTPDDLLFLFQVSLAYSTSFSFIQTSEDTEMSWAPSVSDEINKAFISFFILAGSKIKKFQQLPKALEIVLDNLLRAVEYIPENVLFKYAMECCEEMCESVSSSCKESSLLDNLLSILLSDIQHLQLSAHLMLIKIMPLLAESLGNVTKCECVDIEDEEEKVPSKLLPLVDTLNILNELMENMLLDVKIGECCLVLPNTEPYAFVSAYLFTWLQMLEFISKSPSQVRPGYVAHLEETKLLSSLFSNVYLLMPENPLSCHRKIPSTDSPKKEYLTSLFLQAPKISPGNPSSEEIQTMSCFVFCSAMRKVPASVRTWWNNLDKKSADIVNKFTAKYISGILCAEEIQAVHNNENLFKNMVVKARLGSREVIAAYTVDDFAIELCVQLPANYPLGPITAEKRGKIIIEQKEWRHWLMQLTTVLNYQNGSILDGLNIWKKNLDKKFEGVEECMICYYILHSSTLKLPKLSCHTCRKKFHSACLYKWFHSINNSKCPLCRNEFTI